MLRDGCGLGAPLAPRLRDVNVGDSGGLPHPCEGELAEDRWTRPSRALRRRRAALALRRCEVED